MGLAVIIGALLGFVIPGLGALPSWLVLMNLGSVVFLACFRLSSFDLTQLRGGGLLIFFLLRFVLLPFISFFLLYPLLPELAGPITLLLSLPAGVSTPSLASIFSGSVVKAFALCLLTNLLCPFTIPFIAYYSLGKVVEIDLEALFLTLLLTIITPVLLYAVLRKVKRVNTFCTEYSRLLSIILVSTLGTLAIGMQKSHFINNMDRIPWLALVACCCFLLMFSAIWLLSRKSDEPTRLSYTIASGFNNTGLGIGISILYFPAETTLFLVVCEIPWCLAPWLFAAALGRRRLRGS